MSLFVAGKKERFLLKHIVSFSGGKDSTCLLLMMIERGMQIDDIVFCDTGMEFPQMYKHIENVSNYIKRDITKIKSEKSYEYYLGDHVKRNGKVGYGHPDFKNRWCTKALKIQPYLRYLRNNYDMDEIVEYHGIAYDENHRAENNKGRNILYPLIDWKIIENDALQYCYSHGFKWGGLYNKFHRVSCWCCPLKRIYEFRVLYNEYPHLWAKLEEIDTKSFRKFTCRYSVGELKKRFDEENMQIDMFR